jgi:hypothetical protein
MRQPSPTPPLTRSIRPLTSSGAIEWEELPSLADSLVERLAVLGSRHRDAVAAAQTRANAFERAARSAETWERTQPSELEPAQLPEPFFEPFAGLAMREVNEPGLFRHFFGLLTANGSGRS